MLDLFGHPIIEDGIEIPTSRVTRRRIEWNNLKEKFQFERLAIGQSFAVSPSFIEGADQLRLQNYITGAACSYREQFEPGAWAFTTRQMPDGTVRCWRIDPEDAKTRGEE